MIKQLSIIIPAYNEGKYIPQTLESIASQEFNGDLEVIVVDGQSEDDTIAVASRYESLIKSLRIIASTRDIGHQRNVGADSSHYSFLLFVDADVILPPGVLNALAVKIKSNRPFVASVFHVPNRMNIRDAAVLGLTYGLLGLARIGGYPVTNGDFLLTTRETHYELAHGFAENTLMGEDTDYGLRCFRAGAKYYFFPTISIIASDRRVRDMGRLPLLFTWSRAFIHVIRKGPIPKDSNRKYPYGHYV
jgi:glycosyltransferase involved in cell wall biosynthesis